MRTGRGLPLQFCTQEFCGLCRQRMSKLPVCLLVGKRNAFWRAGALSEELPTPESPFFQVETNNSHAYAPVHDLTVPSLFVWVKANQNWVRLRPNGRGEEGGDR